MMTGRSNLRDDVEYFRSRALQEQLAATDAQSPEARKCHDELSMMYRFKVAMLSTGPDCWAFSQIDERETETA